MWTSYEALCEMGTTAISTNATNNSMNVEKPELDPINVFGVIPPKLSVIPQSQGGYGPEYEHLHSKNGRNFNIHNHVDGVLAGEGETKSENQEFLKRIREISGDESQSPFHIVNASPILTTGDRGGGGTSDDYHHHSTSGTTNQQSFEPQTPYVRSNKMHHVDSALHATSLFPQTAMSATSHSVGGGERRSSHLPPTTLFATPGLTPIPYQQQPQHQSFNSSTYPTATATKSNAVFSRAKQVASRLYYEPSPEMTPPPYYTRTAVKSRKNLNAIDFANTPTPPRYTSSGTAATTAAAASSSSIVSSSLKMSRRKQYKRRTDSLLAVEESKHEGDFGEQRLLFDGMNSGNGGNSDEDMEEELDEEEVNISDEDEKIEEESKKPNGDMSDNNCQQQIEGIGEEGIQHILELFCTLGAAQRMLCSYRCKAAIQIFRSLPNNQFNTGFVQHQVGRAYFEISDYASSRRALETMQRVEPHR